MCQCHVNEKGQLVVCDPCASAQIEARNAETLGQVELLPGLLAPDAREGLTLAITNYFAQFKSAEAGGAHDQQTTTL